MAVDPSSLLSNSSSSTPELPWLQMVLGFIVVVNILHTYLDVRQLKAIKAPDPPAELKGKHYRSSVLLSTQKGCWCMHTFGNGSVVSLCLPSSAHPCAYAFWL